MFSNVALNLHLLIWARLCNKRSLKFLTDLEFLGHSMAEFELTLIGIMTFTLAGLRLLSI